MPSLWQASPAMGGKNAKSKQPPVGWETKRCCCCGMTPMQPCSLDVALKRSLRKWSGTSFWGLLCWWCLRFVSTRYAWMNVTAVQKWLRDSPDNAREGRLGALAYVTLREEGKVHITVAMLEVGSCIFTGKGCKTERCLEKVVIGIATV
jgi:hypothetical protein